MHIHNNDHETYRTHVYPGFLYTKVKVEVYPTEEFKTYMENFYADEDQARKKLLSRTETRRFVRPVRINSDYPFYESNGFNTYFIYEQTDDKTW